MVAPLILVAGAVGIVRSYFAKKAPIDIIIDVAKVAASWKTNRDQNQAIQGNQRRIDKLEGRVEGIERYLERREFSQMERHMNEIDEACNAKDRCMELWIPTGYLLLQTWFGNIKPFSEDVPQIEGSRLEVLEQSRGYIERAATHQRKLERIAKEALMLDVLVKETCFNFAIRGIASYVLADNSQVYSCIDTYAKVYLASSIVLMQVLPRLEA